MNCCILLDQLIITKCPSLFLGMLLILKSALSDISVCYTSFLWLTFAWYTFSKLLLQTFLYLCGMSPKSITQTFKMKKQIGNL